jgi:hypothetical protein
MTGSYLAPTLPIEASVCRLARVIVPAEHKRRGIGKAVPSMQDVMREQVCRAARDLHPKPPSPPTM